ncbi:FAD-dependent oxidoreductase [Sphingobacterium suaedae]|uniref:FAD-dependent oxidoreductase n=1 Tax=Sphingobacterium suaedae TaxID=1686402 RepID=A0ABW5KPS3_9SPHI
MLCTVGRLQQLLPGLCLPPVTDAEKRKFGFTGFLQTGAAAYSREIRRELVLGQLGNLFGTQAQTPTAYFDKVWTGDGIGAGNPAIQHPHQHHGHPLLQRGYLHDKLFFAATETATAYPGYMEGAVIAAKHMADKLV